jgi:TonB-linked SusC/RagA family outer membrane protein
MKKQILYIVLATLFSGLQLVGQNVSGIVLDENGEGVIGATVLLKGSTVGTTTDFDGSYTIDVPSLSDTLEISYIGYETQVIPIGLRSNIDITMAVMSNQLDEIVVVGYGRQKKRLVTGAISRVDEATIKETPILRVEQALQGRTPGVQVSSTSGQPGDEPAVRVRGIGTTRDARPLYVVDGLAVGGIDYLNPGDIESIDVLKDAASSAIYGSRAANGVILITTKSGGNNEGKASVTYDGYYGVQNAASRLDLLNADQYREIMNEGSINAGLSAPFDLNEIAEFDTDWQEALFVDNAPIVSHQLSINGGNSKSSYTSSFSYFSQEGIIGGEESQFERLTGRLNSRHKVSDFFNFGNNLAYTHLKKNDISANTSFVGAYSSALNLDPLTPVIEDRPFRLNQFPFSTEDVVRNDDGEVYGISELVAAEIVNPLALLDIDFNGLFKDEIVGNLFGEIQPIKGLRIKSSIGVNLAYLQFNGFTPLFYLNGAQLNDLDNRGFKRFERFFTWQWNNTASYEKQFGDHGFTLLAGTEAIETRFENLGGSVGDIQVIDQEDIFLSLGRDTIALPQNEGNEFASSSIFGRLNYNYKEKYSLTAIVRRDGSSRFGPGNRFGTYSSLGAAWIISSEDFFNKEGIVNYLKLRGGWGVNGNDRIGNFQFVSQIISNNNYEIGGVTRVGTSPLSIANEGIRWEDNTQINIGVDFGLLENRLQGSVDLYQKTNDGLLERVSILGHVGNAPSDSNAGSIENRGVELALDWRDKIGNFNYHFGVNGAFNKNEITFIANPEKVIIGASWAVAGAVTRSVEGLPIGYFWGYETDGLFQNESDIFSHINNEGEVLQPNAVPGDVRFVDTNGDGDINESDRTIIGNPTPDVTYGINFGGDFAGFDFSAFFQGTIGNEIFNGTQRPDLRFTNRTTAVLDRWTGEGTSNTVPRFTFADNNNNNRVSDLYIEDGSYMRLKNVQIGYSLPNNILSKVKAEKWRFYISGENILTFTKYTGVDPEIGATSSFDAGIDRGVYPQARTIRFGTSVTF